MILGQLEVVSLVQVQSGQPLAMKCLESGLRLIP